MATRHVRTTAWLCTVPATALLLGLVAAPAQADTSPGPSDSPAGSTLLAATAPSARVTTAVGAPRYASVATARGTLMSPTTAWVASGGAKSKLYKKATTTSFYDTTLVTGVWNERTVTRNYGLVLRGGQNYARPWLVGTMDEGTRYSASAKFPRSNVYYSTSKKGAVTRTCDKATRWTVTSSTRGRLFTCKVTIKSAGKKRTYRTRWAVIQANSAMVFGECYRPNKVVALGKVAKCARKVVTAQWKKSRAVFAGAPVAARMPSSAAWTLDVLTLCSTLPCKGTAVAPAWYGYNVISEAADELTASVSSNGTLTVTVQKLPAVTTTFKLTVSAKYEYAAPVTWTITVIPPLVAVPRNYSFISSVYGEGDPTSTCYVNPPGGIGALRWCYGLIVTGNTGPGTYDTVEAVAVSNPNNLGGTGHGYVSVVSGNIRYYPASDGPFTDTVRYRVKDSVSGWTSAWVNAVVSFNNNPNF